MKILFTLLALLDFTIKSVTVPFVGGIEEISYPMINTVLQEQGAPLSIDVVNWPSYPYCPEVNVRIARSHSHLFIAYTVTEKSIRALTVDDNGPVHKDSCVEFFFQIPGDSTYYNFETNCIGTLHAAKRSSITQKAGFPQDVMQRVIRYTSMERKPFDLKESADGFSYIVVIGIPFDVMGLDPDNLPKKIRGNFYKCGDELSERHYISWNPIESERPNFHQPNFFGDIYFR